MLCAEMRGPRTWLSEVVTDHPFQAATTDILVKRTFWGGSRNSIVRGRLFRDSQGRVRNDYEGKILFSHFQIASIADVVDGVLYALHFASKTFVATPFQPPPFDGIHLSGEITELDGLRCRYSLIRKGDAVREIWIAEDLKQLIWERQAGSKEYEWRLSDIERREPSPKLFQLPPDFKEKKQVG